MPLSRFGQALMAGAMVRPIAKLLALLALLLMPFGMQPAAAAPAAPDHAAMPMQHCPEPAPAHDMSGGIVGCTMACSAAVPADDLPAAEPAGLASVRPEPVAAPDLRGLHPDTATPPPRRA